MTTSGLTARLQEIPGVDHATVDLTDSGGGINLRLEPGADETVVMERLRALLVAYGVRSPGPPEINKEIAVPHHQRTSPRGDVDVRITPISGGARVEVSTRNVKSFRVVAATPAAIAQGLADAWCQVVGRVPVEVISVQVGDEGTLSVTVGNGEVHASGAAGISSGWEDAVTSAMGTALERLFALDRPKVAVNS